MEWIIQHYVELFAILTGIVALASAIANLTPTDADNKAVEKLRKVVDFIALNWKVRK